MPYFEITDFKAGLDVRRSRYTSVAGTLQSLVNAHITRGGDIERRKAFVDKGAFGASTFGLAADVVGKVTFGSVADPGTLPDGVRYQRLVPPSGANLQSLDAVAVFGGKLYVAATFDDGKQWHFYDGALVYDWNGGLVLAGQDNTTIAESLRAMVDANTDYSATRSGNVVTITGPVGVDFDYDTQTSNGGSVDDAAMMVSEVSPPVSPVTAVRAMAQFAILGGTSGNVTVVDSVIAGVTKHLLSASVPFNTTPEQTASDVASAINAGTATHGHTAKAQYGQVFVYAPMGASSGALTVTADGSLILYQGGMSITGGSSSPGVNRVTSIKANGVEILGANVDWTTSHAATAAALAAQINGYVSSPRYNAYAEGNTLFISPRTITSGDGTSISITGTAEGDVTFDGGSTPSIIQQYPDYNNPPVLGGGGGGNGRNRTSVF